MTNEQIIAEIAISIFGEEAVMNMLESGEEIPLHTLQGWASRGPYKIKKGEHGIETKLWKKKKKKDKKYGEEESAESSAERDFYLCKSFLFRADQVELIKE